MIAHSLRHPLQHHAPLRRIVDRIRDSLELRVVLQTAVDEVATLLRLEQCCFFWYFPETQQVQVMYERLCKPHPSRLGKYSLQQLPELAAWVTPGELVVNSGDALSAPDAPAPGLMEWLRRPFKAQPAASVDLAHSQPFGAIAHLLVPVKGRENQIGFIACLSDQPRRWSAAEIDLMQAIAQQLEIAIRQAQLYEQTQKQAQREHLVNQITTQTRQSLDLKIILQQAIAHLRDALEVDRCLVHLVEDLDEDGDPAVDVMPLESNEVFRRKHLFEVCCPPFSPSINDFDTDGPITRWVIQHRQQVVISDITQDHRIGPDNEEYRQAEIKSSLVVPVQANGTLQAILYLNQCSHVRPWSSDDQKLAEAVADQLAISIQQGRLYAQTRQQAIESAAQAEHLAETLHNLRQTQAQLIQSEKMSSLGQLVAGVAHEINNPVSFIYGNIPYIEQYVQDLLRLVDACQAQYPHRVDELRDIAQEIEFDFLVQDLPRILQSMRTGAGRIREIVRSLRSFSHSNEVDCKVSDLHEGLDDMLFVLQNQLKPDIQVIKRYGELPQVECYPRRLKQTFLNLLMNAAEALSQSQATPKVIEITTEAFFHETTGEPWVRVAIADNGSGVPYEIQPQIFDPFFTTKEVGQGAGLGLAVSYQTIVNQHQGQLRCHSTPDQGSEFVVELPVKHTALLVRNRNLFLLTNTPTNSSKAESESIKAVSSGQCQAS